MIIENKENLSFDRWFDEQKSRFGKLLVPTELASYSLFPVEIHDSIVLTDSESREARSIQLIAFCNDDHADDGCFETKPIMFIGFATSIQNGYDRNRAIFPLFLINEQYAVWDSQYWVMNNDRTNVTFSLSYSIGTKSSVTEVFTAPPADFFTREFEEPNLNGDIFLEEFEPKQQ